MTVISPEALGLAGLFTPPAGLSLVVVLPHKFSQALGIFSLNLRPVFDKLGIDGAEILPSPGDVRHHLRVPEQSTLRPGETLCKPSLGNCKSSP